MKKKVLKIIQIVYDILSLGFIVFVIVAMAVSPKIEGHHENNVTEVVETKARDNYGYNDEYGIQLYLMATDYKSNHFITNFIYGLNNSYTNFRDTDTITLNFNYCGFEFYNLTTTSNAYGSLKRTYKSLLVNKVLQSTNDNGKVYQYSLDFNTTNVPSTDSHAYRINYDIYVPFFDDFDHEIGGIQCFGISVQYDWLGVDGLLIKENNLDYQTTPFIDYYHNYIVNANVDRYNSGYQSGYNAGYNIAYKLGDTAGYDRGFVDGAQGIETNAFTTLTQAFEAMGSVFSINVLPNLPLWVLVFAPLIVAVVIVIVKLIKGQSMSSVWNFIQNVLMGIGQFWTWLTSPLKDYFSALQYVELGNFKPIELLGIGGLTIILVFWIIKLLNPLSQEVSYVVRMVRSFIKLARHWFSALPSYCIDYRYCYQGVVYVSINLRFSRYTSIQWLGPKCHI